MVQSFPAPRLSLRVNSVIKSILFLAVFSFPAGAVDNVVRVTTPSGEPIPYVRIRSEGAFANGFGFTDAKGEWHIDIPVIGGSACSMFAPTLVTSVSKPGFTFDKVTFGIPCGGFGSLIAVVGSGSPLPTFTTVSAASYSPVLAPQLIVAAFGQGLADTIEGAATLPPPTSLGNRKVVMIGPDGIQFSCPILFVSSEQINFILPNIPQAVVLGQNSVPAVIDLLDASGPIREEGIVLKRASPSLFSENGTGEGVAAAALTRIRTDGTMSEEPVAQFDPVKKEFVAIPIEFTGDTQRLILSLFGTGFGAAKDVQASIVETSIPVLFFGPQAELESLERLDLELPRTLAGTGEVPIAITVDGGRANAVTIRFR